jgi:hypothetical protein
MSELLSHSFRQSLIGFACVCAMLCPSPSLSNGDPSSLCLEAAAHASAKTGVPYDVLRAVATVETGRNDQPWPWTVNFGGDGQWFNSAGDAAESVDIALRDGATNIDLGCFQLNYRWHASAFNSVDDMLNPEQNATYAAEYLSKHYAGTGDWALAAAAYHSGTPEYARLYQEKFETTYARLAENTAEPVHEANFRENRFPLLVAGPPGQNGSLFSARVDGKRLIGAP